LSSRFSSSTGFSGFALELQLLFFLIDLQHLGRLAHRRRARSGPWWRWGHRAWGLGLLGRRLGGLLVARTGHEQAQMHSATL
jgi:hypothetical protein